MMYQLHKYMIHENGAPFVVERADRCETEEDARDAFIDAFMHHMGRKPTKNQVKKAIDGDIVVAKSGRFEMHFAITRT